LVAEQVLQNAPHFTISKRNFSGGGSAQGLKLPAFVQRKYFFAD
jgi:hypothetical protein